MIFIIAVVLLALLAAVIVAAPLARRHRRGEAALAAVFIVGVAIGIYLVIGRPDLALNPPQPMAAQNAQDVVAMVEQLAERLEQAPDDPEGWTMLGRAYVLMGRYEEAARAFNEAIARTPGEDPDLIASLAEARALGNPAMLEGEAGALFERVLQLDPANPRGLWYGGLAAEARGDHELALERFGQLLARDLPADFRQVVESRMLAIDPAALDALLSVEVELAPELAGKLPPDGVLYVFLRAADGNAGGPPLAARRLAFFELPQVVPVTRCDLLRGGDTSGELAAGNYVVGVRISADGDPAPGPGDVEGSVTWNPQDSSRVRVTLDTRRGE